MTAGKAGANSINLTAWDMVLTVDVAVLVLGAVVGISVGVLGETYPVTSLSVVVSAVIAFATWRARRYTTPAPPPTDNVVRRGLGLLLLSAGGVVSALSGTLLVILSIALLTSKAGDSPPLGVLPLACLVLAAGHGLAFAGAKIRAPSSPVSS
jgi:hypothetical protein